MQIFHTKEDKPKAYLIHPSDLFAAINNIFSRNESIVLLTWLGCKGDGSFSPSTAYMLKMTGIKTAENYYRIKRDLCSSQYISEDEHGGIYIDTEKILEDWSKGISKTNRKEEREKSRKERAKLN